MKTLVNRLFFALILRMAHRPADITKKRWEELRDQKAEPSLKEVEAVLGVSNPETFISFFACGERVDEVVVEGYAHLEHLHGDVWHLGLSNPNVHLQFAVTDLDLLDVEEVREEYGHTILEKRYEDQA